MSETIEIRIQNNEIVTYLNKIREIDPDAENDISKAIPILAQIFIDEGKFYILPEEGDVKPNASHINNGYCYWFAECLEWLFPGAEYFEYNHNEIPHAAVRYCGKYYDSECPNGVLNWRQLPLYINNEPSFWRWLYRVLLSVVKSKRRSK